MNSQTLLPLKATGVRHWLRALLVCALFSALHGTVGAWVVPALGSQGAVQICTPHGLQWVGLEDVAPGDGDQPASTDRLLQPCAWSTAHVAIASPLPRLRIFVPSVSAAQRKQWEAPWPPNDHAQRVLLMSAMRAPPGLTA